MITKSRVEALVHHFCAEQGLTRYSIEFSRTKSILGQCRYKTPVFNWDGSYNAERSSVLFRFSTIWMEHASLEESMDTILHEIAHAIAGPRARHGAEWKAVARSLGCSTKATSNAKIPAEKKEEIHKWKGTCPNGHTTFADRLTRKGRTKSCAKCSPRYDARYIFTWEQLR